jgi:hypothetical protein
MFPARWKGAITPSPPGFIPAERLRVGYTRRASGEKVVDLGLADQSSPRWDEPAEAKYYMNLNSS